MNRADRRQVGSVLGEVTHWGQLAAEVRHISRHLSLAGAQPIPENVASLVAALEQVELFGDLASASRLAKVTFFEGRKKLQPAHEAIARLSKFHDAIRSGSHDEALTKIHAELVERNASERTRLNEAYTVLYELQSRADALSLDVAHMPLSRANVLTRPEDTAVRSLTNAWSNHAAAAWQVLQGDVCSTGTCSGDHGSAANVADLHSEVAASDVASQIISAAERVAGQLVAERALVQALAIRAQKWPERVKAIRQSRESARSAANARIEPMNRAAVGLVVGRTAVRLMPVSEEDGAAVAALSLLRDSLISAGDASQLKRIERAAESLLAATKQAFDRNWTCHGDERCANLHDGIAKAHADAAVFEADLQRLTVDANPASSDLDALTDPTLRLPSFLSGRVSALELVAASTVIKAKTGVDAIVNAAAAAKEAAADAKKAGDLVRAIDVAAALKAMDLETLKKASTESIRTAALESAGLRNVWDVLKYDEKYYLAALAGLGETTARSIAQATLRLFEGVRDETPIRIDVKLRGKSTTELLEALRSWDAVRRFDPSPDELAVAKAVQTLLKGKTKISRILAAAEVPRGTTAPAVGELLAGSLSRSVAATSVADVWTDFLGRPSDYFGMLTELGFVTEDEKKMHGDLPEEIVEAVRALKLKREYLTASLRTYQSFGARFALVQRKVVIGDEMGLGKTVEALAVFTHLRATCESHFIVVCPAAVVSNWVRETAKHTKLRTSRIHGQMSDRQYAAKTWLRMGGVAVTTYDLLPWLLNSLGDGQDIACAVFDEAHYIKNPLAKRSLAAVELLASVDYAVLMTGTPLENRVQEFRNLVGYIRPDLANEAPEYLASKFRKHMAPAYLRRNQEDVLTELPELVEIDEWMGMSDSDSRAYRAAVEDGHFMMMRRAAMLSERSLKVERLVEIVEEAEANGRRAIVFSYFRDVLSEVAAVLPGKVFGPLTGSMPAAERQNLVDRFSDAGPGSALVAQITAGGVGLNIQSASVVVICEPQIKPTMESQAIARAHRMGQTNTVQVHRLLTEDSVDERIREILAQKRQLFDDFARESVIAKQAPDAVDMTDAELARVVIAAERERLFGGARSGD